MSSPGVIDARYRDPDHLARRQFERMSSFLLSLRFQYSRSLHVFEAYDVSVDTAIFIPGSTQPETSYEFFARVVERCLHQRATVSRLTGQRQGNTAASAPLSKQAIPRTIIPCAFRLTIDYPHLIAPNRLTCPWFKGLDSASPQRSGSFSLKTAYYRFIVL